MDRKGMACAEQTFQIGDLGRFSMRTIYDALESMNNGQRKPSRGEDPEDSDCSWTQDDDDGTFYFDMQRKLNNFALATDQPTMTTAFLSKSQRRFVHATAQIFKLGHASLSPQGKLRRMIVFKNTDTSVPFIEEPLVPVDATFAEPLFAPLPEPSKKRRRLERVTNGFPCHFCDKLYDRASERTKHEQSHQPNLFSRYQCPTCGKGFRYPKDLRRHSRVHEKEAMQAGTQSLSSSYGSAPPLSTTLTADSRVPSDTSLDFNSTNVSKATSPALMPCGGKKDLGHDLELWMLDENACFGDDWLVDAESGLWNADDEDFLEMAKVRR